MFTNDVNYTWEVDLKSSTGTSLAAGREFLFAKLYFDQQNNVNTLTFKIKPSAVSSIQQSALYSFCTVIAASIPFDQLVLRRSQWMDEWMK